MRIKIQIQSSRFLRALQFTRLCAHCHPVVLFIYYVSFRAALSSRTPIRDPFQFCAERTIK